MVCPTCEAVVRMNGLYYEQSPRNSTLVSLLQQHRVKVPGTRRASPGAAWATPKRSGEGERGLGLDPVLH